MADLITREVGASAKGVPLTNAELDQNFLNLNQEILDHTIPALSAQYPGLNVVDVCFYDTTKDSDGGAWTKRTGTLSYGKEARPSGRYVGQFVDAATAAAEGLVNDWYYNTTDKKFYQLTDVSTPAAIELFRAGSAEFPSQVVIVSDAARVIIFDASGSELTMWMVVSVYTNWINSVKIAIRNGLLVLGQSTSDTRSGLWLFSFTRDIGGWQWGSAAYIARGLGNRVSISPYGIRVKSVTMSTLLAEVYEFGNSPIVNKFVNDVATTTLPNAPTDPLTELKVPTILVATGGGWSLITDSGVVYDGQVGSVIKSVSFGPDNEFYTVTDTGVVSVWNNVADIIADGIPADSAVSNVLGAPTVITGVA
jgi:hypothetical protein